jgi:hypothetical protein
MDSITFKLISIGFILLTLICLASIVGAVRKVGGHPFLVLGVIGLWLLAISIAAWQGFFADFSFVPPRMFIILIVPIIALILLFRNKKFIRFLEKAPLSWPVWIQSFRIVVEILLWQLYVVHLLPEQMTFEGRNWDILVGITAPFFAYFFNHKPKVLLAWNIGGLALLANIVITALLSMPTSFRVFMNEPANTIVAYFPIIWLPAFLVPLAYYMHFISIKQILVRLKKENIKANNEGFEERNSVQ